MFRPRRAAELDRHPLGSPSDMKQTVLGQFWSHFEKTASSDPRSTCWVIICFHPPKQSPFYFLLPPWSPRKEWPSIEVMFKAGIVYKLVSFTEKLIAYRTVILHQCVITYSNLIYWWKRGGKKRKNKRKPLNGVMVVNHLVCIIGIPIASFVAFFKNHHHCKKIDAKVWFLLKKQLYFY